MEYTETEIASTYGEAREEYIKRKESEGYTIYFPSNNELLLDLDTEEDYQVFLKMAAILSRTINYSFKEFPSTTPGHRHVIVKTSLQDIHPVERIALQALLGSDRTREMLSLFRIWHEEKHPSILAMKGEN